MLRTISLSGIFASFLFVHAMIPPVQAQPTNEQKLSGMRDECVNQILEELQEERSLYRAVQYDQSQWSVLSTSARTSDLVPYLVLNYSAFACRLRYFCDAVGASHEKTNADLVLSHRPVGCSRLFAARGRWWDPERRDRTFKEVPIEECAYYKFDKDGISFYPTAYYATVEGQCDEWSDQILGEERQMLRLLVAQDSANRVTRRGVRFFQSALVSIRHGFLEPLRQTVSLFGSIIHPIPCLLSQCN